MEKHVKLDELVERWIAHDFAHCRAPCLIVEHQNVGAEDINLCIAYKEVDLSLDTVSDTDIIRVHPRHEIRLHIESYLHACIERFRKSSILWQRVDDKFAGVRLSCRL